jgi:hydroxymethylbilane synthase
LGGPYRLIVSLNLDRHEILVVGGGTVGERKTETLLASGANVKLISPDVTKKLRDLAESGEIEWERRTAAREDFKGRGFAVLALPKETLDDAVNMAREEGCIVDACADGDAGDFALCAQFEMDGCYVGISSGGRNPAKAALLKRGILKAGGKLSSEFDESGAKGKAAIHEYPVSSAVPAAYRPKLTLLTRNSPLALAQAGECAEALSSIGVNVARRTVTSHGDRDRKKDLVEFGGFGAFVKALEEELLADRGDLAVHSLKDMPVNLPEGCVIASVLRRETAYDVLITRDGVGLAALPSDAIVGTSSLRRRAQARSVRRDLKFVTCRGNIETRLSRLENGEVDALILAEAGLKRLGIDMKRAVRLPFITSAGQGAIAIETLAGSPANEAARELNHFETWCETVAERELLRLMGLGCACPIGVQGEIIDGVMDLAVALYSTELRENPGDERVTVGVSGAVASEEDAKLLAFRLWDEMRDLPLMEELLSAEGFQRWA